MGLVWIEFDGNGKFYFEDFFLGWIILILVVFFFMLVQVFIDFRIDFKSFQIFKLDFFCFQGRSVYKLCYLIRFYWFVFIQEVFIKFL